MSQITTGHIKRSIQEVDEALKEVTSNSHPAYVGCAGILSGHTNI